MNKLVRGWKTLLLYGVEVKYRKDGVNILVGKEVTRDNGK